MAHVSLGGEEGILTAKVTTAALIYTGACYIYWITIDPSAGSWVLTLSDGVATGTDKWSLSSSVDAGFHINFSKPMKMETGIYADVVTNVTHATIGYAKVIT